jgi:hypothetical protein
MEMVERAQNFSTLSPIEAIEANTAEFLLALSRVGGGEERNDPEIQWVIGGSPIDYHNCVVRARLTQETADEAIKASIEHFLPANGLQGILQDRDIRVASIGIEQSDRMIMLICHE